MSKTHSFTLLAVLLVTAATQLAIAPQAIAGKFMDQTGCSQCCPECKHTCKLDVKEVEEEKSCFEVETEVICIPRVVFPWQRKSVRRACNACDSCNGGGCNNCSQKGAKTRKVKILSSRKYKCPKCEYTWSVEKKPSSPCGTGCDHHAVGNGHEIYQLPVPSDVQLQQPAEAPGYRDADSTRLEPIEVQQP